MKMKTDSEEIKALESTRVENRKENIVKKK